MLTTLGGAEVFARGGSARASTTSLLDAQGASLNLLSLQALLGGVGLVRSDHLDEAKATGLLGVRVAHDLALLDITVLLEHASDLLLGQTGVDAGDEEVGARVDGAVIVTVATSGTSLVLGATGKRNSTCQQSNIVKRGIIKILCLLTGRGRDHRCQRAKQSDDVQSLRHHAQGEGRRCGCRARNEEPRLCRVGLSAPRRAWGGGLCREKTNHRSGRRWRPRNP